MATRKVKWTLLADDGRGNGQSEDCNKVFALFLHPFFNQAACHNSINMLPFSANFYPEGDFPPFGVKLEVTGPEVYSVFFDTRSPIPETNPSSEDIGIFYNGKFCGILLIEHQILIATDWTHEESLRPATEAIINKLAENDLLKLKHNSPVKEPVHPQYKVSVGCDPEFELIINGEIVSADGNLGEGAFSHSRYGGVGYDGSGAQVELRPSPGDNGKQVAENIRNLLKQFYQRKPEYRLAASSDRFSCGGHLHLGFTPKPKGDLFQVLAGVLDDFIGQPTKRLNGPRRADSSYGRIGDWRNQTHGMEYRTAPSSVFRNPDFAEVVMQLATNLADKLANSRELTYTTPVNKAQLIEIGGLSSEQADLFVNECNKPIPRKNECLLAAWGIEIKVPKPELHFSFSESWDMKVRAFVSSILKDIEVKQTTTIYLYGLNSERGNVYTFKVPRREQVQGTSSRPNSFGFSYNFRKGRENKDKMLSIMKCLVAEIEKLAG